MAKSSGSTRATNSRTASVSRAINGKSPNMPNTAKAVEYDADYISKKTKEINSFKIPKQNDFEYINIKGENYRVRHEKTYDGRHIIDIIRSSDGSSMGRDVYTNKGAYGYAITHTKGEVARSVRKELLSILVRE